MKKHLILAALLAFAFPALAQTPTGLPPGIAIPFDPMLNQNDIVQVVPRGQPTAQSQYVPPGAIGGQEQYFYQVPLTAFTLTNPAYTTLTYLNPAGTLATGTITMEASPGDGHRWCLEDTQTQTAITITANTGQTMLTSIGLGAITALVANTKYCWFYNAPLAGWIRTQ